MCVVRKALASATNISFFFFKFVVLRMIRDHAQSSLPVIVHRMADKRLQLLVVVPSYLLPSGVPLTRSLDANENDAIRPVRAVTQTTMPATAAPLFAIPEAAESSVVSGVTAAVPQQEAAAVGRSSSSDGGGGGGGGGGDSNADALDGSGGSGSRGSVVFVDANAAPTGPPSSAARGSISAPPRFDTRDVSVSFSLHQLHPTAHARDVVVPVLSWRPTFYCSFRPLVSLRRSWAYQIIALVCIPTTCAATMVLQYYEIDSKTAFFLLLTGMLIITAAETTRVDRYLLSALVREQPVLPILPVCAAAAADRSILPSQRLAPPDLPNPPLKRARASACCSGAPVRDVVRAGVGGALPDAQLHDPRAARRNPQRARACVAHTHTLCHGTSAPVGKASARACRSLQGSSGRWPRTQPPRRGCRALASLRRASWRRQRWFSCGLRCVIRGLRACAPCVAWDGGVGGGSAGRAWCTMVGDGGADEAS